MKVSELFEVKKDSGPVGVPNPSPAAKKNRKMAQAVVAGYTKHIKTSGFNQSYAKKHRKEMSEDLELVEGMYVVKNKDGKEKRFKSAESPDAKAWKESSSPSKVKLTAYSQAWWEKKDETATSSLILPWDKIDSEDVAEQFDKIAKEQGFGRIEDWHVQGKGYTVVDGVRVATVKVRMVFSFGKEDDLGLDVKDDERVSDSQYVKLRRDTTSPNKLVFAGYTN